MRRADRLGSFSPGTLQSYTGFSAAINATAGLLAIRSLRTFCHHRIRCPAGRSAFLRAQRDKAGDSANRKIDLRAVPCSNFIPASTYGDRTYWSGGGV